MWIICAWWRRKALSVFHQKWINNTNNFVSVPRPFVASSARAAPSQISWTCLALRRWWFPLLPLFSSRPGWYTPWKLVKLLWIHPRQESHNPTSLNWFIFEISHGSVSLYCSDQFGSLRAQPGALRAIVSVLLLNQLTLSAAFGDYEFTEICLLADKLLLAESAVLLCLVLGEDQVAWFVRLHFSLVFEALN